MHAHEVVLRYGKSIVVDGASIRLSPGEVTALIGPNGSGTSTLLRSMARLHDHTSGSITLAGSQGEPRQISALNGRDFAREVTLFAQSHSTPEGLAVADIVAFGRHPHRRGFAGLSEADHAAIARAMELTGTTAMSRKAAGELSGGELQRFCVARALMSGAEYLICDEISTMLDVITQSQIWNVVLEEARKRNMGIIAVTHNKHLAERIADRIYDLSKQSYV
jgi:iron complex transport system ATP-binding protein